MTEETLLGAFEGGARGGFGLAVQRPGRAGDVGRLHGRIEMVVDDGEGAGISIVDAPLLGGQLVLDQLIFDAVERQRSGGVEAERAKVAGKHLHRRDAAGLDRLDKLGAGREGKIVATPQTEALRVGKVLDRGGAGGGDIDDAGIGQGVLQAKPRAPLLRGRDIAPFSLAAASVLHRVRLVENDHSVEIGAQPFDDLLDPRNLLAAVVGTQRGIGCK